MASLLRPFATLQTPGPVKPQGVPRIDWTHPLANGLLFYGFDVGGQVLDLARGLTLAFTTLDSTIVRSASSEQGTGINYAGATGVGTASDAAIRTATSNGNYSFASRWITPTALATNTGCIFNRTANNSTIAPFRNWSLEIHTGANPTASYTINNGGALRAVAGLTALKTGIAHTTVGVLSGATFNTYCDGVVDAAPVAGNTAATTNTNDNILFGVASAAGTTGNNPFSGLVYYGAFWSRVLSADEVLQLHLDPYCFLLPPETEMPALLPAAGAPATPQDQPNPQTRRPLLHDVGSSALALLLSAQVATPPFSQTDFPNPIRQRPPAHDPGQTGLPLANTTFVPGTVTVTRIPTRDWRVAVTSQQSINTLLPPAPVTTAPFVQRDWPNPRIQGRAQQEQTPPAFALVQRIPITFGLSDWQNPIIARRLLPEVGQSSFPAIQPSVNPVVASQTDWPNPLLARRAQQDSGPPSFTVRQPIVPIIPTVHAQTDWPNPLLPKRAIQEPGPGALTVLSSATLIVRTPLITRIWARDPWAAITSQPATNVVLPGFPPSGPPVVFGLTDQPNPRIAARAIQEPGTIALPLANPVYQYRAPLVTRIWRPDWRAATMLQSLGLPLPIFIKPKTFTFSINDTITVVDTYVSGGPAPASQLPTSFTWDWSIVIEGATVQYMAYNPHNLRMLVYYQNNTFQILKNVNPAQAYQIRSGGQFAESQVLALVRQFGT